jgi:hypothetical protein
MVKAIQLSTARVEGTWSASTPSQIEPWKNWV